MIEIKKGGLGSVVMKYISGKVTENYILCIKSKTTNIVYK